LRINTSNPPGNEQRAADFFCDLFSKEGMECQVFEIAPGRANAYARLRGDGSRRPIILLNHTDVVTADAKDWSVRPFSAEIRDGAIYGRGAQDMKAVGMLHAMAMVALKREGMPLARRRLPSGSGQGSQQHGQRMDARAEARAARRRRIPHQRGRREHGAVPFLGVDVAEKVPFWLRLVAHCQAGHGSVPLRDAAPHRLVRALARVVEYKPPLKVLPEAQRELCDEARVYAARDTGQFCHLETSLHDPAFRRRVSDQPDWGPLLRNTISLTVLHGSPQTNVIPAKTTAELDVACCLTRTPRSFSRNSATSSPTRRSRSNQSRRPAKRTLRPWITSFGASSSK
jgi:acetylornithine deacetylase/succinyl-diaminopimelate desuccinylase-like protein